MKFELQDELLRRFPNLFRQQGKCQASFKIMVGSEVPLQDDIAPLDERGVECGDGWFSLIDRLSRACEHEIETLMAQGVPQEGWPRIAQIKEKMGGLRFYARGPLSDDLRTLILQVENEESLRTCERCGAPGKLRDGPWRHTYCDICEAKSAG